ncbi:iron-containing alcohol dehydrogenase, partial [Roseovarius sp.]|uniref:iron-containing alcohol dehydrogenase n=1 Tax=Roseovarius sp. TaxID=1486281 RepID=UPI00356A8CD5
MADAAAPGSFDFRHGTGLVRFGAGALDALGALAADRGCRRALLVLDGFFAEHPVADRLRALLPGCVVAVHVIKGGEPDADSLGAAARALTDREADLVVALGGGSALDTAKAARGLAANPGPVERLMLGTGGAPAQPHPS